jgi:predicted TIM-barrel fold metal-dependent hydrolase
MIAPYGPAAPGVPCPNGGDGILSRPIASRDVGRSSVGASSPPSSDSPVGERQDESGHPGHEYLAVGRVCRGHQSAVHALRLIGSGLFDDHPRLDIILGHLGEGLPFYLWRIDNHGKWMKAPHQSAARRPVTDYFRENFYVTTSGHLSTPALLHALSEIGADRIMFSADYPFEDLLEAAQWLDSASIDKSDRARIGRANAIELLKL